MAVVTLTDPANNGTDVLVTNIATDAEPTHEIFTMTGGTTVFPATPVPANKKVRLLSFTIGVGSAAAGTMLVKTSVNGVFVTLLAVQMDPSASDYTPTVKFNAGPQFGLQLKGTGVAEDAPVSAVITYDTVELN